MKILVISLLRLGDILLATPVIRGLKAKYPGCEIHLLVNKQFKSLSPLIPAIDEVHFFDRQGLQDSIGQTDRSPLEGYYELEGLIRELRAEKFDSVINLTHNRLSAWIGGLVRCGDTRGIAFNSRGGVSTGSNWFDYLNESVTAGARNIFHYIDVFFYGAGLESADRRIELKETEKSKAFASQLIQGAGDKPEKIILLQPCTSEDKKTLAPAKWREICGLIARSHPGVRIMVLGAPSEKFVVEAICKDTPSLPLICSFDEAFSLLMRADLLITGDTSIKHLASATPVRILEVSIGSSAFFKTGAYSNGSIILQTQVRCAPCPHSMPCHQASHLCADQMPTELVAMTATTLLRNDETSLRFLAHEYRDEVRVLRTSINAQGDWAAYELAPQFSADEIGAWVDRTSHKMLFQKAHQRTVGEFGTEGVMLKNLLQNMYPEQSAHEWKSAFGILEKEVTWLEHQVAELLRQLQAVLPHMNEQSTVEDYLQNLEKFIHATGRSGAFSSYAREFSHIVSEVEHEGPSFKMIRKLRERLTQAHQRSGIELKLVRGLQNQFTELR